MTRQFLRACKLSLAGSSSFDIYGGGPKDLTIEFSIGQSTIQQPHPGLFRIYNPNPQTVSMFKNKEFQKVEFFAGYEDNCGFIYNGDIQQSIYAWDNNPSTKYIDIFTGCFGNAYQQSRIGQTLAAGWRPENKVNLALDAMKPFGITGLGLVNVDLSTPAYPRGRPFIGMARDLIRQVALSKGAVWWMSADGKVNIVDHNKPLASDDKPVVLNSKTGLIGNAHQSTQGVIARILINSSVTIGTAVKIDERSIIEGQRDNNLVPSEAQLEKNLSFDITGKISADGIYRVAFMDITGSTRGNDWYMDLTCLGTGASLSNSQIQGYDGPIISTGPL